VSAPVFHADPGEILRQASAVVGNPVVLWEVGAGDPPFDIEILRRWNVPLRAGSRWVAAPGGPTGSWVVAPVRSQPPAPPPGGRERRSRERLTLELAGLALGLSDRRASEPNPLQELSSLPAMIAHEASNPLTAARAGLQVAMESVARWGDLSADRRLLLLDDLGQVVEDIDRATGFLRAVQDRARGALARSERFDVVRVVQSCLTLERRLLRERGLEVTFSTTIESSYLRGDPNALFDLLVNLVRNAADASVHEGAPIEVHLTQNEQQIELVVRDHGSGIDVEDLPRVFEPGFTTKEFGRGSGMGLAKVRSVAEGMFGGQVHVESAPGAGATFVVVLPVPPQRNSDPRRNPASRD